MLNGELRMRLLAGVHAIRPDRQRVYILIAREGLGLEAVAQTMGLSTREVERSLAEASVELLNILDL